MPAENVCRKLVAVPAMVPEGVAEAFVEAAKPPPPQATVQTKAERRINKHKGANFKTLLPIFQRNLVTFTQAACWSGDGSRRRRPQVISRVTSITGGLALL